MASHVAADEDGVGGGAGALVDDAAGAHDDDAVGSLDQFVEVFADEEDGGAAIADFEEAVVDEFDRSEIEAEAGIGGDQRFDWSMRGHPVTP